MVTLDRTAGSDVGVCEMSICGDQKLVTVLVRLLWLDLVDLDGHLQFGAEEEEQQEERSGVICLSCLSVEARSTQWKGD